MTTRAARLVVPALAGLVAACVTPRSAGGLEEIVVPAPGGSSLAALRSDRGRVVLSWIETRGDGVPALGCAVRRDGSWGPPRTVTTSRALVRDPVDPPAVIPLADGSIAAHWTVRGEGASYAHDLLFSVSRDDGASWSASTRPHRDGTATEHGFATCVPDTDGSGADLVWLDGRETADPSRADAATQLRAARWDGRAFGPEIVVDPRVCDCCKTAAFRDGGRLVAVYRDRLDGDVRDIASSRRDATAWSAPSRVHADGWALTACPTNGPSAVVSAGRVAVAWFTASGGDPRVLVAFSEDRGATFGAPVRIDRGNPVGRVDLAPAEEGAIAVAWVEKTAEGGEVVIRRIEASGDAREPLVLGRTLAGRGGGFPRLTAERPDRILAAWNDAGPPARIRLVAVAP